MGWNDAWSKAADYKVGDVVRHEAIAYKCTKAVGSWLTGVVATRDDTDWIYPERAFDSNVETYASMEVETMGYWSSYMTGTSPSGACVGVIKALVSEGGNYSSGGGPLLAEYKVGSVWHAGSEIDLGHTPTLVTLFSGINEVVSAVRFKAKDGKTRSRVHTVSVENSAPPLDPTHWQKLTGGGYPGNF